MNSSINISLWAFPASIILGLCFVVLLWFCDRYYSKTRIYALISGVKSAILLSLIMIVLVAIEGIWAINLYRTWYFILISLGFMTNLGFTVFKRFRSIFYVRNRDNRKNITNSDTAKNINKNLGFLLNHIGLFLVVWGMFFGAADYEQGGVLLAPGSEERFAQKETGELFPLPFKLELEKFTVEYYDDGVTPKQFVSSVLIDRQKHDISVNSPYRHGNYYIYQSSYDMVNKRYSVVQVVYDPWSWVVWIGIATLALGAIIMIFKK